MGSTAKGPFPRKKFIRCPKCNEIVKQNETFCRKCGEFIQRKKNTEFVKSLQP